MDKKEYKRSLLECLYQKYENCQQCPLAKQGRKSIVFGQGDPNAKLMLVGEGPGKDEDLKGEPFVGRAGKLLNKLLEILKISREEIFISNTVKCRPPCNRLPLPSETSICINLLLDAQIKIIRPTVICTLGSCASNNLLDQDIKITKVRGQQFKRQNIIIIPTLHPAYILRNPKQMDKIFQDIQLAYKISQNKS